MVNGDDNPSMITVEQARNRFLSIQEQLNTIYKKYALVNATSQAIPPWEIAEDFGTMTKAIVDICFTLRQVLQ